MDELRIGYLSSMHHSSHILKALGLLESESGVVPRWHLFGTGPAMVEAFAAGDLDIGYIGLPPVLIAIGRGIPLVCIAGGHCEGTVMVCSRHRHQTEDHNDIRSVLQRSSEHKIGVPAQGSIHDIILRHMLHRFSLGTDCVVNYAWADLIAEDVRQGTLAAAVGTPPLAVMCRDWYGFSCVLPPAALWPFNPSYGIAVHAPMLKHARLLRDVLSLHERACNMIRLEPQRAAEVVAAAVKVVDADFVKEVFAVSPRYCAALPRDYIEATMAFVPVLRAMGHLERDLRADEVFDTSHIEAVHPDPSHY